MAGAAKGQAPARRDVASDLAADADVRAFDRGLDGGPGLDGDVAARLQVTLDVAGDPKVALDLQATLQDVPRAEADNVVPVLRGAGRLGRGFFS